MSANQRFQRTAGFAACTLKRRSVRQSAFCESATKHVQLREEQVMPSAAATDTWLHAFEVIILAAGAFFAIRQLRLQREEIHSNALLERRRRSMEIDARLGELSAQRRKVETVFPPSEWSTPIPLERLQAAFREDEHIEAALRQMIAEMDFLALPVCADAADENIAFELIGSTVVAYATTFRSYIMHLRSSQNRPDFYIYLTTLVDTRWAERDKQERELIFRGGLPFFLR